MRRLIRHKEPRAPSKNFDRRQGRTASDNADHVHEMRFESCDGVADECGKIAACRSVIGDTVQASLAVLKSKPADRRPNQL
jgi:hypothetical protein